MNEQLSSQPQYNQTGQIVLGNQVNIAGNVADARAIYAGLTAQALLAACQSQVQGVLNNVRQKYDPTLYVHRAIETELTTFFDQPLADPNRNCYLIVAPAGSGKTNLLCDLARVRVEQQPVVLLLGGSAYLSGSSGLLGTLQSELEAATPYVSFHSASDSLHILHQLASALNQDVLLLLDAINEHDQPAQMRKAVSELLRLTRNKRVKLVITCRDFYWNLFKGSFWDEATINSLPTDGVNEEQKSDHEEVQGDFYRFAAAEHTKALNLYLHHYTIKGQPVGAALEQCRHPLLLRFFCEAYKGQEIGEIEDIRLKELFDRYWDQKLVSIAERRLHQGEERLQEGLISEVATYLLSIASYMLHHNERAILLSNLSAVTHIPEETSNPRSLYGRIRDEFIILEEQERGTGRRKLLQVAFVYEEFMEYVMARALLQAWDDQNLDDVAILQELNKLKQIYHDLSPILNVMVYLAIMLKETRNLALWSLLLNNGGAWRNEVFEDFKKLHANQLDAGIYAALLELLAQNDSRVQVQVLDLFKLQHIRRGIATYEALFKLVCELAVHHDEKLARRATLSLQYGTVAQVMPIYFQNLGHKSSAVRQSATTSLINSGEEVVRPLIAVLRDENKEVRQAAITALGQLEDVRAVEPLMAALKDENKEVRQAATTALGWLGAYAVEPLMAALKDENKEVRQGAATALSQLEDVRAVEPLIAALKDKDKQVQQAATEVLGRLWDARTVELLIAALTNENKEVRQGATTALGRLGTYAVEPLMAALKDENEEVGQAAATALGHLGARAVEPLMASLKDENKEVRQGAATALGRLGRYAVEPLMVVLKDENKEVGQAAAAALSQLGACAVEPLIATLKDENEEMRQRATTALGRLGAYAVEPLIAALKDKDKEVRHRVATVLGRLGVYAVKPLIVALKDKDGRVWQGATTALGQLDDVRAVEPLMAALKDENKEVRQTATQVLGRLRDVHAVELLMAALKDKDARLQQGAATALSQLGEYAVEFLIAALKDENKEVRQRATEVLGRLGEYAVEPLITALKDKDDHMRQGAAIALGQLRNTRSVEPLIATFKDENKEVQQAAATALERLGIAVESLMTTCKDENKEVLQGPTTLRSYENFDRLFPAIPRDENKEMRPRATTRIPVRRGHALLIGADVYGQEHEIESMQSLSIDIVANFQQPEAKEADRRPLIWSALARKRLNAAQPIAHKETAQRTPTWTKNRKFR